MDIVLKGEMDGITAADIIRQRFGTPVIFLTVFSDSRFIEKATRAQPYGFLRKPFDSKSLCAAIEIALNKYQAEVLLLRNEERYRRAFEASKDAMTILDASGFVIDCNDSAEVVFGQPRSDLLGRSFERIDGEASEEFKEHYFLKLQAMKSVEYQFTRVGFQGREFRLWRRATPLRDGNGNFAGALLVDRCQQRGDGRKDSEDLEKPQTLVKEAHHRVKNSMQMASSFLHLQARTFDDPRLKEALFDSRDRLRALSLLHDRFATNSEETTLDISGMMHQLANQLLSTWGDGAGSVKIQEDYADIHLEMNRAQPLILGVSEIITNVMKYAFREGNGGVLSLSTQSLEKEYRFRISDNGPGIPEDIKFPESSTLGLQLIYTLLIEQLGAEVLLSRKDGTHFEIVLPK